MPRRVLLFLIAAGSVLLASCGTSSNADPQTSSSASSTPGVPSESASGSRLFVSDGTFVVKRAGIYNVLTVGGGGGGGGGGSALAVGGVTDQAGEREARREGDHQQLRRTRG